MRLTSLELRELDARRYQAEVLPLTASLWARHRDFPTYAMHTGQIAASGYGRRNYRTVGLYDGERLVASFKRYRRVAGLEGARLQATGIGAVFTPAQYRGRGYASAMIGAELDRARNEGGDLVYLFSDIAPQFYAQLGFIEVPSREISVRSDALPSVRLRPAPLRAADWAGVQRCFGFANARATARFLRTPLVWEWLALRMHQGSERDGGEATNFVVRRGRAVVAYVLGERNTARDTYLFDEFGFADAQYADLIPALLRAAAGDLRRIRGWLPPAGAVATLRGVVRKRKTAICMAAPLSLQGRRFVRALLQPGDGDPTWRSEHI